MDSNNLPISNSIANSVLGDQVSNFLEVLKTKGIVDLAAALPDGGRLLRVYSEIKESGNSKIPEIQRNLLADVILTSFIMARHNSAMVMRILSSLDPDDVTVAGINKQRLYTNFLGSYGKCVDTLIKAMRQLGYEGANSGIGALGELMQKLIDDETKEMKASHEEQM